MTSALCALPMLVPVHSQSPQLEPSDCIWCLFSSFLSPPLLFVAAWTAQQYSCLETIISIECTLNNQLFRDLHAKLNFTSKLCAQLNEKRTLRESFTPNVDYSLSSHVTARSPNNIKVLLFSSPCDLDILFKYSDQLLHAWDFFFHLSPVGDKRESIVS